MDLRLEALPALDAQLVSAKEKEEKMLYIILSLLLVGLVVSSGLTSSIHLFPLAQTTATGTRRTLRRRRAEETLGGRAAGGRALARKGIAELDRRPRARMR